jgi:Uma2 family endonuclease
MTLPGDLVRGRRAIYWRGSNGMAVQVDRPRRLFTADEFERMAEAGVFRPDERLELIHGEIVEMSPVGPAHGAAVANLNKRFVIGVGDRAVVWIQSSARVAFDSVPEPDLALLRPHSYRRANPRPDDILLVVEVAETSLRYDRTDELALYASAGIQGYWVVGVEGEWLEVYRSPEGHGDRESRRLHRGDTIAPPAFPDVVIDVAEIFA